MNPAIVAWLLLAINAWGASPIPAKERDQVAAYRQRAAEEFAAVAYDPDEPPLYRGAYARALTALDTVSIASLESRIQERIARGDCRRWECDHNDKGSATAVGLMQAHPGEHGLRFLPAGKAERCGRDAADCWKIDELAASDREQIRAGVRILRTQGYGAFARSGDARAQAVEWLAKHPPPVADANAWVAE
jgi:hypothetical protein